MKHQIYGFSQVYNMWLLTSGNGGIDPCRYRELTVVCLGLASIHIPAKTSWLFGVAAVYGMESVDNKGR